MDKGDEKKTASETRLESKRIKTLEAGLESKRIKTLEAGLESKRKDSLDNKPKAVAAQGSFDIFQTLKQQTLPKIKKADTPIGGLKRKASVLETVDTKSPVESESGGAYRKEA